MITREDDGVLKVSMLGVELVMWGRCDAAQLEGNQFWLVVR